MSKISVAGRVIKSGRYWAVEIDALRIHTQGRTRKEAMEMAADAVRLHAEDLGAKIPIAINPGAGNDFYVESPDKAGLVAFVLKRQRQRAGLSVREAAKRLGSASPSAYARYETGEVEPGLSKMAQLLDAVAPGAGLVISVGGASERL